jgi:hypothetical protein
MAIADCKTFMNIRSEIGNRKAEKESWLMVSWLMVLFSGIV